MHFAAVFLNVEHRRADIVNARAGAERAGGAMGSFEIDISMQCSISDDREAARRAAKRPAAQGILWMAGAERYSRQRTDWQRPRGFNVPENVVQALATWDFWTQPHLPAELADLITDDVLDQFALAGTPEECAARLRGLKRDLPQITSVRLYTIPPAGKPRFAGYLEMIVPLERLIRLTRAA